MQTPLGLRGKPEQRTGARLRIALLFDRLVHGAPPCSMDFRLRKQTQRAEHVEKQASRENNAQAQDIMRALAALYRELAEELQDSGLFEGRFLPLGFADLPGGDRSMIAGPITGAGHGAP